jgi:hypothetical protein
MLKKILLTICILIKEKLNLLSNKYLMKYKDFTKEDKKYIKNSIFMDTLLLITILSFSYLIIEFLLTILF